MAQIRTITTRTNALIAAVVLLLGIILGAVPLQRVAAGSINNRSLMVSSTQESNDPTDGAGLNVSNIPGHPNNGTMVDHIYTFQPYTVTNLEQFTIEYCDAPFGYVDGAPNCATDPNGFDASAWGGGTAVVRVGGINPINYAVAATGTNYLTLTGASASVITSVNDIITITFTATVADHFQNPDNTYVGAGANQHPTGTYFAHITTYGVNPTYTLVDEGTVTNNVTESISIYTRVQETLNFSVEGDDANDGATAPGLTCSPLVASGTIRMGDSNFALATNLAYNAKSYFRLATNSSAGASVYYSGYTLTSGSSDIIDPIGAGVVASTPGTEQFGLAFDSSDASGQIWTGQTTALAPIAAYGNNATGFAFDGTSWGSPVVLAASTGVVTCETGALEYVANIDDDTDAGIYTTRINYIASPSY